MSNEVLRAAVQVYLAGKRNVSIANDAIMINAPRCAVLQMPTPQAAVDYYWSKGNPYTGDPFRGAGDHYLHPERLQYGLIVGKDGEGGWGQLFIDCDDVAGLYFNMLQHLSIELDVYTIIDERFTLENMSHVFTAGVFEGQPFVVDTNGYHAVTDLQEATLCQLFNSIYAAQGINCTVVVKTDYPFR